MLREWSHVVSVMVVGCAVALAGCGDESGSDDPQDAGQASGGEGGAAGPGSGGTAGKGAGGVAGGGTGGNVVDAALPQNPDAPQTMPDAGLSPDAAADANAVLDAAADVAVIPDAAPDVELAPDAAPDVTVESGPFAFGPDGTLTVSGAINFSTMNVTAGRTCADGGEAVAYSVVGLGSTTATLKEAPSAGCLAVGDEVVIINLQGTSSAHANVGNYETLKVASISAAVVTFAGAKTNRYGSGANDDADLGANVTEQRVVIVRVPTFAGLVVKADATVTANAWDGVQGGVLYLRIAGAASIAGSVSMDGKGYRGGVRPQLEYQNGLQGESYQGLGTGLQTALQGGGGGGVGEECASFGSAGGGAGYGTPGTDGTSDCTGKGGLVYGDAVLAKLYFGSGGGSGGNDNVIFDNPIGGSGGAGGGILVIKALSITVTGKLSTRGAEGQGDLQAGCFGGSITDCWDYSGAGGGGSGGSLYVVGHQLELGDSLVDASAGAAGLGGSTNGGVGGMGRIAVRYKTTLTGTSSPPADVVME